MSEIVSHPRTFLVWSGGCFEVSWVVAGPFGTGTITVVLPETGCSVPDLFDHVASRLAETKPVFMDECGTEFDD